MSINSRRQSVGTIILITGALLTAGLVLFPVGWVINRLNVQIWWFLLQNTPLTKSVTPEDLAELWNIAMFVPLGLGLSLILPRWWWILVLVGTSFAIETTQFLFLASRNPDYLDVVMNSIGGVIGVTGGILVSRWCEKRRNRSIDSSYA